jgi:hypothetical protein
MSVQATKLWQNPVLDSNDANWYVVKQADLNRFRPGMKAIQMFWFGQVLLP